jgi:hypothetical protein
MEMKGSPMATLKQIAANRRNSQASTGPRTPAGKAAVRFNALKSGIDAASQLIPGEDPEVFEAFAADFTASCDPACAREQELVDQLIDDAWRLRRLRKAETQQWTKAIATIEARNSADYPAETRTGDAYWRAEAALTRIQRMVAGIKRSFHRTSADLDKLQAARAKMQEQTQFDFSEPASPCPPQAEETRSTPTLVPVLRSAETKPIYPPDVTLPETVPFSPVTRPDVLSLDS